MVISREVRIGILFTLSVLIFFVGFYFLKGSDLFSSTVYYNSIFNSVDGLPNSANVQIKGLNVGRVTDLKLEGNTVRVTYTVDKDIKVPQGTIASISGTDLLGSKVIKLDPGPGPGVLPPGSTLPIVTEIGLVDKVSEELTPRLRELKTTITLLDSALASINTLMGPANQRAVAAAIESIRQTADNLSKVSAAVNTAEVNGIVHNAHSITANLAKSNDTIQRIINNVSKVSGQLANAPIQKTLNELEGAAQQMRSIADRINSSNGSLGQLINNKDLYNNLNNSVKSLHNLMDDIKANPKRYVNISIFGGSKKK